MCSSTTRWSSSSTASYASACRRSAGTGNFAAYPPRADMPKAKKPSSVVKKSVPTAARSHETLLRDVRHLLEQARQATATAVNSALVLLYWQVGHRVRTETLANARAAYGKEILSTLSKELVAEYGSGFSVPNLSRMVKLAEFFPDRDALAERNRTHRSGATVRRASGRSRTPRARRTHSRGPSSRCRPPSPCRESRASSARAAGAASSAARACRVS